MKKRLYSLLLLCSMSMATWAQDMTHVLVVEQQDCSITKFSLLNKPVVSIVGSEVQISQNDEGVCFSCNIDDVKKYYFITEDATAISDAKDEAGEIKVIYTDGQHVVVSGLVDGDILSLYSIDGRKTADVKTTDGQAQINLTELANGIYVVSIKNKQSFKIVKR